MLFSFTKIKIKKKCPTKRRKGCQCSWFVAVVHRGGEGMVAEGEAAGHITSETRK